MRLQKSDQMVDKSGSMIPNKYLDFVFRQHWRKAGCLSEDDLGIFSSMLKK